MRPPGECNQLRGFGIGRGRVLQRGGEANRSIAHRVPDQNLHLFQLRGCGLNVRIAQHDAPDRGRADIAGEVNAHALFLNAGKILAKVLPVGRQVVVLIPGTIGGEHCFVKRSGRIALAGDLRSDALIDL